MSRTTQHMAHTLPYATPKSPLAASMPVGIASEALPSTAPSAITST